MPLAPIMITRRPGGAYLYPDIQAGYCGGIVFDWSAKDISAAGTYHITRDDATTGGSLSGVFNPQAYYFVQTSPPIDLKFFRDTYIFFGKSGSPGPITFAEDATVWFWLCWEQWSTFPGNTPEQVPLDVGGAFTMTWTLTRYLLSSGYSAAYAWNNKPTRIAGTRTVIDTWVSGQTDPGFRQGGGPITFRPGYWIDVEEGDTIGGVEFAWEADFTKPAGAPQNRQELELAEAQAGAGTVAWGGDQAVEDTWIAGAPPPPFWTMIARP